MEIVDDSLGRMIDAGLVTRYRLWKQGLQMWPAWVRHRRRPPQADAWNTYILDNCRDRCLAFNCGGLFYRDWHASVTVLEYNPCPLPVSGMMYLARGDQVGFGTYDSLILNNPIVVRWQHDLGSWISSSTITPMGPIPRMISWLNPGAEVFLSFSDWYIYHDRFRYHLTQMVKQQLEHLERAGFECVRCDVTDVKSDIVNGNVKLHLRLVDKYLPHHDTV